MDLQRTDCMVVMGSNFAENHPVGFRFVMKAKELGGKLVHIDPRFTRTSALADLYAPLRAGSDIVFLGALINYVINSRRWNEEPFFKEYVLNYTNAATLINPEFRKQNKVDETGFFAGWNSGDAHLRRAPVVLSERGEQFAARQCHAADRRAVVLAARRAAARRAADRGSHPPGSELLLPAPQGSLPTLHAGAGGAGLRHAARDLPPGRRDDPQRLRAG